MEEILSSIKRIIAEEGEEAVQAAAPRRGRAASVSDHLPEEIAVPSPEPLSESKVEPEACSEEVLELTDEIMEEPVSTRKAATEAASVPAAQEREEAATDPSSILSVESEIAARQSLSALSSMLVTPAEGVDNTLDGLVRAMLRPMLKDWLDARLPSLVEEMVAKEISRITNR